MLGRSKVISEMYHSAKSDSVRLVRLKRELEASIGHQFRGKVAIVMVLGLAATALLVACAPSLTPAPSPGVTTERLRASITPSMPSPTPAPSPEVKVEVSSSEIYPGGLPAVLVALVGGLPASELYSYFWSATHEGLNAQGGRATYTASAMMPPGTKIGITVLVDDAEGLIGMSSVDITVSTPPPLHYLFVLDASERTAQKLNGKTWLEEAKGALEGELDWWILDGANVGLRVFGYTEEPSEYCKNTELLVAIAPENKDAIKDKLAAIEPRREAALHEAIREGLDDLVPECDGSCRLTVITQGRDACMGEHLDAREIFDGLRQRSVLEHLEHLEMHEIAVAPSEDDVQALVMLRDQLREEIPSTFYYSADEPTSLKRILDYIALSGAPDPLYQSIGYGGLGEILQEQGDSLGAIQMFDRSLEPVLDANEALYQRGLILGSLGVWEKANQDFTILTVREPREDEVYYFLRGVTWYNMNEYQLAEMDFAAAVNLNPDFALAEYALGLTLVPLGQPGKEEAFKKALEIEPNLFDGPYFETVPPEYKVPSFYETATTSELFGVGQDFFSTIFQTPEFLVGP
jgi:tetratricopeptide (TPR) repeat protein